MKNGPIRKIIHVDMDAFYASVEQRDYPELRGKPVIVGGLPNSRGVVATCSYEARKFGIHSAMPSMMAYKLCPHAIFVKTNMEKYRAVSRQVMAIFHEFTDLVEPLSLDEAYLDVTEDKQGIQSATLIARNIKRRIREETRLTASAGVSYNKFLAKVSSGYHKPDGLTVITPEQASAFIHSIPIGDFHGVGKVTEKRLLQLNIKNGADLSQLSLERLVEIFKDRGRILYDNVRGIDHRPVVANRKRKSIGKETTLKQNIIETEEMLVILKKLVEQVCERLQSHQVVAKCVVLKLKFEDFEQITKRSTLERPTRNIEELMLELGRLLDKVDFDGRSVRLLGVSTSQFQTSWQNSRTSKVDARIHYEQLTLF